MLARVFTSKRMVVRGMVLGTLLGALLALPSAAQPGRGGGMSPEARAKVDAAKVAAVAAELKLDAEKSGKLAEVYGAYQKENEENPPQFDRGDREAMRAEFEKRQAKLESDLKTVLDEAQVKEAAELLGGGSRGWDRLVAVIIGFELGAEKEAQALAHTIAYVKAGAKAREDAAGQGPEAARSSMMAAKKSLDDSLAPLLSDEQKAKWSEDTSWGGRGGGRGGDRGGDRGGREERGNSDKRGGDNN